eukprot:02770_5
MSVMSISRQTAGPSVLDEATHTQQSTIRQRSMSRFPKEMSTRRRKLCRMRSTTTLQMPSHRAAKTLCPSWANSN